MYNLPYFKENNEQLIKEFIGKYPFAFLTGVDAENKPVATQVPVFIEEVNGRKILRGHIMKNTDHHKAFLQNENVLVVFNGPHCYVSGTWYSDPHTASTWNYMSVHAKGTIQFLDNTALIEVLRITTLHFENNDRQSSTIYDNLPSEYTQKLMNAIVAFEIEVENMDAVFKLSQNRDKASYQNIIKQLRHQGGSDQAIADEMEKRIKVLFPEDDGKWQ